MHRPDSVLSVRLAVELAILGIAGWLTGATLLLPSLGPSAYALEAGGPDGDGVPTREVVLGQYVGAGAATLAVVAVLGGISPMGLLPGGPVGLGQVAALAIATALATLGMQTIDAVHPPAYATVLIVCLGVLSAPVDVAWFALAVPGLVLLDRGAVALLDALGLTPTTARTPGPSRGG